MRLNDFDAAYDFAVATRHSVAFSEKMLRVFAARGYWTQKEVAALLRIRLERSN
jgi:hypothetical protein